MEITFSAVAEDRPGPRWQERFVASWDGYRRWYLRDGDGARPSFATCRRALRAHLPELVDSWEALVELAGGGDLAARMLSLWDPPPLVSACSQLALAGPEPLLARNYDFDPALLEGIVWASRLVRGVLGMSDCLWGVLDGINDAGLAVSLAFGGRRATGPGFAVPIVVRYLLETCATTAEAAAALDRVPVQAAYNLTLVDAAGAAATVAVGPDRPSERLPHPVAANHQRCVEWPEHATAVASREREARLLELLGEPAEAVLAALLAPPLRSAAYADGFGTLYTAAYIPHELAAEYRWPGARWRQSLTAFAEGSVTVRLPGVNESSDCSHAGSPGQQ